MQVTVTILEPVMIISMPSKETQVDPMHAQQQSQPMLLYQFLFPTKILLANQLVQAVYQVYGKY